MTQSLIVHIIKTGKSIFFILLGLFAASCIYSNEEVFVNTIKRPTSDDTSIDLTGITGTITINSPTTFSFTVFPQGRGNYKAIITVNTTPIVSSSSTNGIFSFEISPAITGDGEKTLKIIVEYPSHSASLAGKLNVETITYEKEWTLIVNTAPPPRMPAPQVYLEDGKSMVSWNSPTSDTFTELVVYREYASDGRFVARNDQFTMPSKTTTQFHDATYAGGTVTYRIDLKGFNFLVQGEPTTFHVDALAISIDSLAPYPVATWGVSPLYNNNLKISLSYNTGIDTDYPINEAGDKTFTNLRFGEKVDAKFQIKPINPSPSQYFGVINRSVQKGIQLPAFIQIEYLPIHNAYMLLTTTALYRLNANTWEISDTLTFQQIASRSLVASFNGVHFYLRELNKLKLIDINSLNVTGEINLENFTGSTTSITNLTLSNDNILVMNAGIKYAIDLNTLQELWRYSHIGFAKIAMNSEYVYINGKVLGYKSNSWIGEIGMISTTPTIKDVIFWQDGQNKLIVYNHNDSDSFVYDLDTAPDGMGLFYPQYTFPHTHQFDRHGVIFYYNGISTTTIYNALTLNQVDQLNNVFESYKVIVSKGVIFHKNGFVIPN